MNPLAGDCDPLRFDHPARTLRSGPVRAGSLLALIPPLVAACTGSGQETREGDTTVHRREDLQAACEAALASAVPIPVRRTRRELRLVQRIGGDASNALGRIAGAAWHEGSHSVFVLDGLNGRVVVFDSSGRYVREFGRLGSGPGEFDEVAGGHGGRTVYNQLAFLDPEHLVVNGFRHVHLFSTNGTFLERLETDGARSGPLGIRHVTPWTPRSVLVSETGAMDLASENAEVRTELRLIELRLENERLTKVPFDRLRNPFVRFWPFDGPLPRDPYGSSYARTWDATNTGLLVALSYDRHGACFMDRQRRVRSALAVDAPVIPVNRVEREKILDELRASLGPNPPMAGGSWEDFYSSWPDALPFYVDVVLGADSIAWLERPAPSGTRVIDLLHPTRGYLGSVKQFADHLPLVTDNDCGLVVDLDVSESGESLGFYGLSRWCIHEN